MFMFTENQKKRIAHNIRKELNAKSSDCERNQQNLRLASLVGVSSSTVSRWVSGTKTPDMERLIRLARVFGVPLHRLCGYSGKSFLKMEPPFTAFGLVMNLSILEERTGGKFSDEERETLEYMHSAFERLAIPSFSCVPGKNPSPWSRVARPPKASIVNLRFFTLVPLSGTPRSSEDDILTSPPGPGRSQHFIQHPDPHHRQGPNLALVVTRYQLLSNEFGRYIPWPKRGMAFLATGGVRLMWWCAPCGMGIASCSRIRPHTVEPGAK